MLFRSILRHQKGKKQHLPLLNIQTAIINSFFLVTSQVFTSTNNFYLVCAQHFFKISLSPEHSHHGFHIFCNYLKVSSVCKGFPCFKLTKKRASFGTLKHPKHITLLKTAYFWLQNIKEKNSIFVCQKAPF